MNADNQNQSSNVSPATPASIPQMTDWSDESTALALRLLPAERDIVVFHLWPDLAYARRMALALAMVLAGFVLQAVSGSFAAGLPLLFLGSILLTVQGYHNRVETGAFNPGADWETVDSDRLQAVLDLDRKILRWSESWMDVTNTRGILGLMALLAPLGIIYFFELTVSRTLEILLMDAVVLLVPHWVTGIRQALRQPTLIVKANALKDLWHRAESLLSDDQVSVLMLLEGKARIPEDVKLRIAIPETAPEFLGIYVQAVTNDVKGTSFPYVYCVLVARQGYGLLDRTADFQPPANMVRETKTENDVEIVVLRQHTTKNTGYHTDTTAAYSILRMALEIAHQRLRIGGVTA